MFGKSNRKSNICLTVNYLIRKAADVKYVPIVAYPSNMTTKPAIKILPPILNDRNYRTTPVNVSKPISRKVKQPNHPQKNYLPDDAARKFSESISSLENVLT